MDSQYSMHEEHSYANMDFRFVYQPPPSEPDDSSRRIMFEIDTPRDLPPQIEFDKTQQVYHCNESMDEEKENITMIKEAPRRERVCVVGCSNPKKFFRVPLDKATRKIWRKRLSLTSLKKNSLVCDSHFSSNLFGGSSGRKLRQYPLPDRFVQEDTIYIADADTQTDWMPHNWEESIHNCVDYSQTCVDCTLTCEENNQTYIIDIDFCDESTQTCEHLGTLAPSKIFPGMVVYNLRTKLTFVCASIINFYVRPFDGRMLADVEALNLDNLDGRLTDVEKVRIVNHFSNQYQ